MKEIRSDKRRGLLVSVVTLFLIIVMCEGLSRMFYSDEGELRRILNILQQDAVLFWRQRPNLDKVFEGARVITNGAGLRAQKISVPKPADTLRVICLGGSPTFGWGVESDETYANKLQGLLKQQFVQKKIEVINAGMIGYSSYQGVVFLKKEILALSPDVITVAYVINDVDKHRFFRSNGKSDKDLKSKNQLQVVIENVLDQSRFFAFYKNMLFRMMSRSVRRFGSGARGEYSKVRRVSLADYENNLMEVIGLARENGIGIIFVKMPVNLPSPVATPLEKQKEARQLIEKALLSAKHGLDEKAIVELESAVRIDPNSSEAYFYLGRLHERMGHITKTEENYEKVRKTELYECARLGKKYNETMERIAAEEHVPMVDVVSVFDNYQMAQKVSLFQDNRGDTIHPNAQGHDLIARALYDVLKEGSLIMLTNGGDRDE